MIVVSICVDSLMLLQPCCEGVVDKCHLKLVSLVHVIWYSLWFHDIILTSCALIQFSLDLFQATFSSPTWGQWVPLWGVYAIYQWKFWHTVMRNNFWNFYLQENIPSCLDCIDININEDTNFFYYNIVGRERRLWCCHWRDWWCCFSSKLV